MASCTELWVNRLHMSTNMAAGREGQCIVLNENDIYRAKLVKEPDLLTKTEAIRWLKCRSFTVVTSMINWPLSLLEFDKVLLVCGHKEFRYTSDMARTRCYLWTQRVKCPNREDMRSKVSLIHWCKVYLMVRESLQTTGRPLNKMSLR